MKRVPFHAKAKWLFWNHRISTIRALECRFFSWTHWSKTELDVKMCRWFLVFSQSCKMTTFVEMYVMIIMFTRVMMIIFSRSMPGHVWLSKLWSLCSVLARILWKLLTHFWSMFLHVDPDLVVECWGESQHTCCTQVTQVRINYIHWSTDVHSIYYLFVSMQHSWVCVLYNDIIYAYVRFCPSQILMQTLC